MVYPLGTNFVTWTVTDRSGNTNSCVQRVIVRDLIAPTLTCPGNLVLTADAGQCSRSNVTFTVIATDNCGVTNQVSSPPSGSTFPAGTTTVTNAATDASGNRSSCTFTVTVLDPQPPAIACPPDLTTNAAPGANSVTNLALGTPLTTDNCAVAGVSNNAPAIFPAGTNFVLWTATDASGNASSCQQRVVVVGTCSGLLSATPLASQTLCPDQPVLFATAASSPEPITYLWRFNGQAIAGQTTHSLALASAGPSGGGIYAVEVRTACAALTNRATLTVLPGPAARPASYTNSEGITINEVGVASPYVSVITPQCVPGLVSQLTVHIFGFYHGFPADVSVVLISPNGRQVKLMAGAGGGEALLSGVDLTFSDAATSPLPEIDTLVSGTYTPTDYLPTLILPSPADGPYATSLAVFMGLDPNGPWELCVLDSSPLDGGAISRWSLDLDWRKNELQLQNPQVLANVGFRMEVLGQTGVPTIIQRSSNLVTWVPVATNIYGTTPGVFLDPTPLGPNRFYRAVQP